MSTFLYPSITTNSAASATAISVVFYRPTDRKTFDFNTNTFVSSAPTQQYLALTQDAVNTVLWIASFDTTALLAQFTDGSYVYLFYDLSTGTPVFLQPASVTLVGGVEAAVGTATVDGTTVNQIAVAVRDVGNSAPAGGSLGAAINSAASAGDPWATTSPGSYASGTFGHLVSAFLDAAVSTRLPTSTYSAPPTTAAIAAAILVTPAHPLATDVSGAVTAGTVADKAGYALTSAYDAAKAAASAAQLPANFATVSITAGAFSTAALANAPSGTATLDPHLTAILSGDLTVNNDGSWTFFDRGTNTQRVTFGPKTGSGGRTVTFL